MLMRGLAARRSVAKVIQMAAPAISALVGSGWIPLRKSFPVSISVASAIASTVAAVLLILYAQHSRPKGRYDKKTAARLKSAMASVVK